MRFRPVTTARTDRTRLPGVKTLARLGVTAFASLILILNAPLSPSSGLASGFARRQPARTSAHGTRGLAPLINRPDVLDLEPAVTQAELILAVRLVDVTETKIVHGGRDVQVTEQYRFEPVRVLKGIFARESLLLTGQDLGIYRFAGGSERLPRGQLMLVLLGRQGQNYFNCCAAPTLGQSIPRLEGKDDPCFAAVEALIGTTRVRDRLARVELLRDALKRPRAGPFNLASVAWPPRLLAARHRGSPRRSCLF